ncbi:MAG: BatA domain-containing protein, partial [Elusimicrobiota bacterium]
MNFAFPAALWALPAAGLPVLVHLLSRRAARRLPFSDLTLLSAIEARSRPRSRLREILLIVARCLLLACLVLGGAGATVQGSAAAG